MLKTIITPNKKKYSLTIPDDYIGKKLEIILYAIDEMPEKKHKISLESFNGILSNEEYEELKSQTEKARKEWSRDF